ncbi:hypothetical protein V6Z11_D11G080000 [Gossypium hirsutum]
MNYTVSDNKKHLKALISLDLKKLSSFVEAVIQQRVYKIWEVAIPQDCKGIMGLSGKWMENHVEFREYNVQLEEFAERGREMIEIMDYKEPGPNTNPRSSYIFGPPPQPQP